MTKITEILKNHISASNFGPATHGAYERYLKSYIAPFFGDAECSQLDQKMVRSFADRLVENNLSPTTAKGILSFLKKGLAGHYPPGVFEVGLKSAPRAEISVLSRDEQRALETAARRSDRTTRICVFMCLYTGIRIGELCGLTFDDVSFAKREFHVRRTVQRVMNTDAKSPSKTVVALLPVDEHSNRRIPLPGFLLDMLGEHRGVAMGSHVISMGGGVAEPRGLQYRFKKLLLEANIKQASFQILRHTFALRALENGFDVTALSKILGHASPVMTYSRYATLVGEESLARRSMESLAQAMQG